jgi:hypothetical protein
MTERHQPRTEDLLTDGFKGSVVAAVVLKAGGEMRIRFRDLSGATLTVTHDDETDELVLRAKARE